MEKIEEIKNKPCELTMKSAKSIININGLEYIYSIQKLDKDEGIKIKLFESIPKTNIYYEYEASISELTKNIKILLLCENLDEMINLLITSFNEGKVKFIEKEEKYYIELQFEAIGKSKISIIELQKFEPKDPITEINDKIHLIENECKNLSKEIEELKNRKDKDIKEIIKEVIQEKDLKMELFQEFERIICKNYKLTAKDKKEDFENNLIKDENSHKEFGNIELIEKDEKQFNKKIQIIEENLNKTTNDLENIKSNLNKEKTYIDDSNLDKNIQNNELLKKISDELNSIKKIANNYIELKIKIPKKKINKNIKFIQQCKTYKYFYNFERDDIVLIIDGENASLSILKRDENFNSDEKSSDCYTAQKLKYNLEKEFNYYWTFKSEGIHIIKIIFRKKLFDCSYLFRNCEDIVEIDMSNFDCSQVTCCTEMFFCCYLLKKLNLGTLDFALSRNFERMFWECKNLEELDVSHFNTKNALGFSGMFYNCQKLKKIDVSKFDSSKCKSMGEMFTKCESLNEIDMINWDMSSIIDSSNFFYRGQSGISHLFNGCKKLKKIKMSSNFSNIENVISDEKGFFSRSKGEDIFKGLPEGGKFYWKKGVNCNALLNKLPVSWNREQE